jgi:hypothetical protein
MANLTQQERLVVEAAELAPLPAHFLLVFKRIGRGLKLQSLRGPGEAYSPPFLDRRPDSLTAYVVPSDPQLRYRFSHTYRTHDQLRVFTLHFTIEFRVSDPLILVQKFESDPLQRVVDEVDSIARQRIKHLDWSAIELEPTDLAQVLFYLDEALEEQEAIPGFTALRQFAEHSGLYIQRIGVVRELPEEEIRVPATALKVERELKILTLEHKSRTVQQELLLNNIDAQKKSVIPGHLDYDIALSFAGEDRQHADEIARLLREKGAKVFYDKYAQDDLWGKDLYEHLADVYTNRARYCIILISTSYAHKNWTTHERKSAQARAFRDNREYILPVRLDDTEIPGIPSTIGYLDLRQITPQELAEITLRKLGR